MNITADFTRLIDALRKWIADTSKRFRYGPDVNCSQCGQRMNWTKGRGPGRDQCARCWYGRNDAAATRKAIEAAERARFEKWKRGSGFQCRANDPCPCKSGRKWKHCHGQK